MTYAHGYHWGNFEIQGDERAHPHTSVPEPVVKNDQVVQRGDSAGQEYAQIAPLFGKVEPGQKTKLINYDYRPYEQQIDDAVKSQGYEVYYAGGKYGRPDLANRNYNTGHLMVYDPTPGQGGDFDDEAQTRSWRKIHELAHALAYKELNAKYGEGRRIGKLGVHRTLREAKRAVEWEWLALMKQRQLSESMGYKINEEEFARELNTVMHDAVHRAVTGKFTNPDEEGFVPSNKIVPLEVSMKYLEQAARAMGLKGEDDILPKRSARRTAEEYWVQVFEESADPDEPFDAATIEQVEDVVVDTLDEVVEIAEANDMAAGNLYPRSTGTWFHTQPWEEDGAEWQRDMMVAKPDGAHLDDEDHAELDRRITASLEDGFAVELLRPLVDLGSEAHIYHAARTALALMLLKVSSMEPSEEKVVRAIQTVGSWIKKIQDDPMFREAFVVRAEEDEAALIERLKAVLTPDLRKGRWQTVADDCDPMTGHCYVASEALRHLLGPDWKPMFIEHEGSPHWFLQHADGRILDVTSSQFKTPVPYDKAKGKGFLTKAPSARARKVLERMKTASPDYMFLTPEDREKIRAGIERNLGNTENRLMWELVFAEEAGADTSDEAAFVRFMTKLPSSKSDWKSHLFYSYGISPPSFDLDDDENKPSAERMKLYRLWQKEKLEPWLEEAKRFVDDYAWWSGQKQADGSEIVNEPKRPKMSIDEWRTIEVDEPATEVDSGEGLRNILRVLSLATPSEVDYWGGWYQLAQANVQHLAQEYGLPFETAAAVVAVLSPGNKWALNLRAAAEVIEGATRTNAYPKNIEKARRILETNDPSLLTGPKVKVFYESLVDPASTASKIVLDGHAMNIWRGEKKDLKGLARPTKSERAAMVSDYEKAAQMFGLTPQAVQAITWYIWKSITKTARSKHRHDKFRGEVYYGYIVGGHGDVTHRQSEYSTQPIRLKPTARVERMHDDMPFEAALEQATSRKLDAFRFANRIYVLNKAAAELPPKGLDWALVEVMC